MEHHPFISGKVDACDIDLRTERLPQRLCLIVKAENAAGPTPQRQRTAEPVQPWQIAELRKQDGRPVLLQSVMFDWHCGGRWQEVFQEDFIQLLQQIWLT